MNLNRGVRPQGMDPSLFRSVSLPASPVLTPAISKAAFLHKKRLWARISEKSFKIQLDSWICAADRGPGPISKARFDPSPKKNMLSRR